MTSDTGGTQAASSARPLLSPEEIAVRAGQQVPFLLLPRAADVFADRELRMRQLAAGHAMRDFILFAADLVRAQHELLGSYPKVALPDAAALDAASRDGVAPLATARWRRDGAWREGYRRLVGSLLPRLQGSPAESSVRALADLDDASLERQADRLLSGVMFGLDLAAAPLVAAALQVYWTHLVIATDAARGADRLAPFGRIDDAAACPCCGSGPVASVSRIDGGGGHRYLQCSLCSAQWHVVRIKCARCQSTKGIHYQSLQARADTHAPPRSTAPVPAAVEAETCDECRHYLKIARMERDPHVEAMADDLASVTLDLLVAEAGFERHGVNLLLLFGESEPQAAGDPAAMEDGGGG